MCMLFLVPRRWFFSPTHKGSINGQRLVPPSRSGYALRLGAMIRLTIMLLVLQHLMAEFVVLM